MTAADRFLAGENSSIRTGDNSIDDLRMLVGEIGRKSFAARAGSRRLPETFDRSLWDDLEKSSLTRLTSTPELEAGPAELAVLLRVIGQYAGAVPVAETDLLAAYIGQRAGLELPSEGPMTIAIAEADMEAGAITGTASNVPWARSATSIVLIVRMFRAVRVGVIRPQDMGIEIAERSNVAGEPRDRIFFRRALESTQPVDEDLYEQVIRRGAWARCLQIVGALDAAAELTVTHCRERIQFGRRLSSFQSVQQGLAEMAGRLDQARAVTTLAVAAAAEYGFDSLQADSAVSVAKVLLGDTVSSVTAIAHQLHGAIGITLEHDLRLFTMRAQSWVREFGSTDYHARRVGQKVLESEDPWAFVVDTSRSPASNC